MVACPFPAVFGSVNVTGVLGTIALPANPKRSTEAKNGIIKHSLK